MTLSYNLFHREKVESSSFMDVKLSLKVEFIFGCIRKSFENAKEVLLRDTSSNFGFLLCLIKREKTLRRLKYFLWDQKLVLDKIIISHEEIVMDSHSLHHARWEDLNACNLEYNNEIYFLSVFHSPRVKRVASERWSCERALWLLKELQLSKLTVEF